MEAGTSARKRRFLYDNEINRRMLLMNAVQSGDIQTAQQLIAKGTDVNFILKGCTLLHTAVSLRRIDILELLLSQPNIDLNIQIRKEFSLVTPLLWSLYTHMHGHGGEIGDEFILRLIQAGCDINITDELERTPLHLSMSRSTITIACELIKRGADDINKQSRIRGTALHYAIEANNLEAVCMLLYYNADVYIEFDGQTPFSYAVNLSVNPDEIKDALINYYDFLHTDINHIMNNYAFLRYTNGEVFKAVWARLDQEIVLNSSFMYVYLYHCTYTVSEWVECLYLILTSTIAYDLIESWRKFLSNLQDSMYRRNVQPKDRLGIIYTVLSLGIEVQKRDINKAVTLYGLVQDLEALIFGTYCGNKLIFRDSCEFVYPPHAYSIGMETDYTVRRVLQLFMNGLYEWGQYCQSVFIGQIFANAVRYFSFPVYIKRRLLKLYPCQEDAYAIMVGEQLQNIPEFPSLTELSRNKKCIHFSYVQLPSSNHTNCKIL